MVEDEAMMAILIEDMLELLGCTVVGVAGTVSRGLEFAGDEALAFDAAILDVNLGGEKVYPVARRLRERGVPFMFSTAYDASAIIPDFAQMPLLQKPYRLPELAAMLSTTLNTASGAPSA